MKIMGCEVVRCVGWLMIVENRRLLGGVSYIFEFCFWLVIWVVVEIVKFVGSSEMILGFLLCMLV